MDPEPEKLESVPPVAVMSDSVKSDEASESEKERVAVSPAFSEEALEETAIVGLIVSTLMVTELLASDPSALLLPVVFVNDPDAIEITPSEVLFSLGVKVTLYEDPEPEKLESVPPENVISDSVKSLALSERVKLIVAV